MSEALALLEFKDEAEAYVNGAFTDEHAGEDSRVIALSAAAQLVLKANNVPFENTLPYFSNAAHARALTVSEDWLKLIETHDELDDALRAELLFVIRPVFSYMLWLAEIIAQAELSLHPGRLRGPTPSTAYQVTDSKLTPLDRPLGTILRDYAASRGLTYEAFGQSEDEEERLHDTKPNSHRSPSIRGTIVSWPVMWLIRMLAARTPILLLAADSYGLGNAVAPVKSQLPRITCMILDPRASSRPTRRLLALSKALLLRVARPGSHNGNISLPVWAFPHDSADASRLAELTGKRVDDVAREIETTWRHKFEHRGIDLAPHIAHKLRGGIRSYLMDLSKVLAPLRTAVEAVRPSVVLSPFCREVYNLLGQVCRELEVPSVMVTHGTHVPPRNDVEEIEQWRLSQSLMLAPTYDYTVAQSPWAKRHASHFRASDRTLDTGPLLFANTDAHQREHLRQRLGIAQDTTAIVYAVTQKKRSSVKFHVFEEEDEYLGAMADLAVAIGHMDNAHLVLKLHPSSEFSDEDIRLLLPPCEGMSVLHREPFADVLSAADVLVSYSSTTIEEALLNRIPVVLYDKWARYRHIDALDCNTVPSEQWRPDAAYYVSNPDLLPQVLAYAEQNAAVSGRSDELYARHVFKAEQVRSLGYFAESLMNKRLQGAR